MSHEEAAAAELTQRAADVAAGLTTLAAAEAAAVVKVATAAHAELAPSVLVVSMFETVQRQVRQVDERLEEINKWMARADERHRKMTDGINTLSARVEVQNGGVTKALNWIASHDSRMESVAIMAKGRKAQRDDDMAIVRGVQSFFKEWWPLIAGAALGGIGVGSFLWNAFGGPPW